MDHLLESHVLLLTTLVNWHFSPGQDTLYSLNLQTETKTPSRILVMTLGKHSGKNIYIF